MDQHRFFNACMLLMNIDMHELVDAGIIKAGNVDNGGTSWKRFNDEPLTFLAKIDDVKRDALWKLIEARQEPHTPTKVRLWIVSTCIPERGEDPCLPNVFASEAEAEAYADEMLRAEWDSAGIDESEDELLPYPGDWRAAQERLVKFHDDGSWGKWAITSHEIALPEGKT